MKRPIVLRVRDARTKAELCGVTADAAHTLWKRGGWGHSRTGSERVGSGDSPFTLKRMVTPNELLPIVVEAPGYAPALVEIDENDRSEKVVELQPPGTVELTFEEAPAEGEVLLHWIDDLRRRLASEGGRRASGRRDEARGFRALEHLARGPDPASAPDFEYVRLLRWTTPFQTWPLRGLRSARFDGLPPGDWGVLLRARVDGVLFDVGIAAFAVAPGATTAASVRGRTAFAMPRVPVRGTIAVAPEWGSDPPSAPLVARLECVSLDPSFGAAETPPVIERPLVADAGSARLAFDFGLCWPGTYVVRVPYFHASQGIAVAHAPGAVPLHEILIAAPADVELTLRLQGVTRSLDRARIDWWPADAPVGVLPIIVEAKRGIAPDLETGRFRFRAPATKVRIGASPVFGIGRRHLISCFAARRQVFDLVPGRNEISMELARSFELVVILRDGMGDVPFPEGASVAVEQTGARLDCRRQRTSHGNICLSLPGPGRYRVTVAAIPGYEDPGPADVEVSKRHRDTVLIALRRKGPPRKT